MQWVPQNVHKWIKLCGELCSDGASKENMIVWNVFIKVKSVISVKTESQLL